MTNTTLKYKIAIVGGSGVGKSALTVRFVQGKFIEEYDPTIEDSYKKYVELDSRSMWIELFDTAGVEDYHALRDHVIGAAEGFLVVYSITDTESLEEISKIIKQIRRTKETENLASPLVIVGNKSDLQESRQISWERGQETAQTYQAPFMETSALNDSNVEEAFIVALREIRKQRPDIEKSYDQKQGGKRWCLIL
eukprot:gb/GECH01001765.1/.p1 GENE.gb/GECH01001765.1/~~gb/GECH01001765.1/.p1  ORF type:complete len:195 (+),score=49.69 gb/GECH01001765.1/:1-585(+)